MSEFDDDHRGRCRAVMVVRREIDGVVRLPERGGEAVDFLQRNEEKLWFWGIDRAGDLGISAEFLREAGLKVDRRTEFPRRASRLSLPPEKEIPAFVLGPIRRGLAESIEATRSASAAD